MTLCFLSFDLALKRVAFFYYSHSDNNLVELGDVAEKDDDKADLLEGGLTRSTSVRFHNSSIRTNIVRLVLPARKFSSLCFTILQEFSC